MGFALWGLVSKVWAILSIVKLFMDHAKAEDENQWMFREVCLNRTHVQLMSFSVVLNKGDFKHIFGFFLTRSLNK